MMEMFLSFTNEWFITTSRYKISDGPYGQDGDIHFKKYGESWDQSIGIDFMDFMDLGVHSMWEIYEMPEDELNNYLDKYAKMQIFK